MSINPMPHRTRSGRSGDPRTRLGQVLAKDAKDKQDLSAMPKGFSGGVRTIGKPGVWVRFYCWLKHRARSRG